MTFVPTDFLIRTPDDPAYFKDRLASPSPSGDAARLRPLLPQSTLRKRQVQLLTLESIQFLGGLNQVGYVSLKLN